MSMKFPNRTASAALLALSVCFSCGRGGNTGLAPIPNPNPDVFGPTATIVFPGTRSTTDQDMITVTGRAFDPSGVAALSVNGVLATTSSRFDHWRATVALVPGENVFSISTTDLLGNVTNIAIAGTTLNVGPFLAGAQDVRLTTFGLEALTIDDDLDALIGVNLATGHRRAVSSANLGAGPEFTAPNSLAIYAAGQRALVLDPGGRQVLDVDLVTGDRTVVADALSAGNLSFQFADSIAVDEAGQRGFVTITIPSGSVGVWEFDLLTGAGSPFSIITPVGPFPEAMNATALDLDAGNSRLFMIDEELKALIAIDTNTATRTTLSSTIIGEGPVLIEPRSIRYDSVDDVVYVADAGLEALIAINLTNGDRSIVSDATHGTGPSLAGLVAVELDSALSRALVSTGDEIITIDLLTGDRLSFSGSDQGFGPTLSAPSNAYGHLRTSTIIVQDNDPDMVPPGFELFRVDVNTGNRDITASSNSGTGIQVLEQFSFECNRLLTEAIAIGRVLISGEARLAVYTIDLASSDRTLNYVFPSAPVVLEAADVEFDGTNGLAFAGFEDQIWQITLKDGTAKLLSGPGAGSGPALLDVQRITLDLFHDRLLVTDLGRASVMIVRLDNGNRADVTGPLVGSGPSAGGIQAIDIDARRRQVLFTDRLTKSVLLSKISDGKRTYILDGESASSLFPGETPVDVVIDPPRNVAYVIFEGVLDAIMMVEMQTLDKVIISR